MPKTKKPKVTPKVVVLEESEAKVKFRVLIENYKVSKPEKYAQKEAELLKKLNQL